MPSPRKYTFGPVPSRRLGRSLGIDLVPFKTCPFDCVYCQLGRTTCHTVERAHYVPVKEVLDDVASVLAEAPAVDYLTLSGSGEPALHAGLGEIIHGLRRLSTLPIAVLTNGALLSRPDVRRDLAAADLVIPSLDAGSDAVFQRINRPHPAIDLTEVVSGLRQFRQAFRGAIWLEILFVLGFNDSDAEVERLTKLCRLIAPDRIQLNTVTRPPAEAGVEAVGPDRLAALAARFGDRADVIASHLPGTSGATFASSDLLAMLRRRPCTRDDLLAVTGLHPAELTKRLGLLREAGQLSIQTVDGRRYYATPAHLRLTF